MALRVAGISKRFGSLQALDSVSLEFAPGEVHAVLGENGAGKSTLVNVMAGLMRPDSGQIWLDDNKMPLGDPVGCRRAGISVVHQHFKLVPSLTVAENLALVKIDSLARPFDSLKAAGPALARGEELGWRLDPRARIHSLPVGTRQHVEILKCLSEDGEALFFDEPTAPLSAGEVEELLRILRALAREGKIVVLIAHKLGEVLSVADRFSVLRLGKVVAGSLPKADVSAERLAELMVGGMPPPAMQLTEHVPRAGLEVKRLRVRGDFGQWAVRGVDFTVGAGEIVGIGGVDGNGQTELAEALVGVRPFAGTVTWLGAGDFRAGYVPADRQNEGLALDMTVGDNLLVGRTASWPRRREADTWEREQIDAFSIKAEGPASPTTSLSGGNQQKVVVARALSTDPSVVVAVNPTRGLDLVATRFVQDQLRKARERGAAVVLLSADLDELYEVADRVIFLSRGELSDEQSAVALVGS